MPVQSSVESSIGNCLLDYSFTTTPAPLQASPDTGDAAIGEIDLVVSNGTDDPIYCDEIQITLPVGPLAQDLVDSGEAGSILYAASPQGKWAFDKPTTAGVFTARPTKPEYAEITSDGIYLQLYNIHTNAQVGTFELTVREKSHTGTDPDTTRTNTYEIPKFPYGFSVTNFWPASPAVNDGEKVKLSWQGSENAKYLIMYGQNQPVDVTSVRTWTTPQGIHVDTTFILDASAQVDGETVHVYLSTTVNVLKPDLTATSLNVLTTSNLNGATQVGTPGAQSNLAVNGGLTASGATNLQGATTVAALTARGVTNLNGGATVRSGFSAQGASLQDPMVTGQLNALTARVSMLGPGKLLASGTSVQNTPVRAETDGFAVVQVNGPGDNSKSSFAYGGIYTIGTWFNVLGGTVGSFGAAWRYEMNNNLNSMCIPIPANTIWQYAGGNAGGNQRESPIYIYWFPLGSAAGGGETVTVLSEAEAAEAGISVAPPPSVDLDALRTGREPAAAEFVALLERAFGEHLAEDVKAELSEQLLRV